MMKMRINDWLDVSQDDGVIEETITPLYVAILERIEMEKVPSPTANYQNELIFL